MNTTGRRAAGSGTTQRVARVFLGLGVAAVALFTVREFIPALAWGVVLAIGLWPAYARADRWAGGPPRGGHGRTWLPLAFCLATLVLIGLPLALVGVQAAREAHDAAALYHRVSAEGIPVPARLADLPLLGPQAVAWWSANLARPLAAPEFLARVDGAAALRVGRRLGAEVSHRGELFAFALVTLFILLREGRGVAGDVRRASGNLLGPRGERVVEQAALAVRGTVDSIVLVGLAEGAVLGVGYAVAHVPHATLLGLLTAVAAMLPYALLAVVAGAVAWLALTGSLAWAVALAVLAFAVTFVADHAVRPAMMGNTTRLPFLWTLFGALGGLGSYGLVGLFAGPVVMAVAILLWRELVQGDADVGDAAVTPRALAAE